MIMFCEWAACATGLLGALLLALNNSYSRWGWVCFMASNLLWISWSISTGAQGLFVNQAGYTITSLIGLFKWFPITRLFVRT